MPSYTVRVASLYKGLACVLFGTTCLFAGVFAWAVTNHHPSCAGANYADLFDCARACLR